MIVLGLLPATPQPAPIGTGTGPLCTVRFADGTTATVPDGALIIPDTHTIYYVGATAPCAVDYSTRLTAREGLTATVGGGRYKMPAPPGATPAAAALANPATATALTEAFTALSGLFARWLTTRAATLIATGTGAAIILSAEAAGEAPDGGPYEDYLARPVTQKALDLSTRLNSSGRKTGQCDDDQFNRLKDEQQGTACDNDLKPTCENTDPSQVLTAKAQVLKACVDTRINVMDTCFDGGNEGHKIQAREQVRRLRKCQEFLRRTPQP
jgi:hypothetical protein